MEAYWDRVWVGTSGALDSGVWAIIDRHKFGLLKPHLSASGRGLEVGCGSGRLSAALAGIGYEICCVDLSAAAVALTRRRFTEAHVDGWFVRGDGFKLPFADGSFDVVLSTGLLEHFVDPAPIVREMVRVLCPGGLFYSDIVPRKFSLLRAFDRVRRHMEPDFFERGFSHQEIRHLLASSGLERLTVFPVGIYPPRLPIVGRFRIGRAAEARAASLADPVSSWLDGTWVAEKLGVYYFCIGHRPGA